MPKISDSILEIMDRQAHLRGTFRTKGVIKNLENNYFLFFLLLFYSLLFLFFVSSFLLFLLSAIRADKGTARAAMIMR
jgi:hypothetical protein